MPKPATTPADPAPATGKRARLSDQIYGQIFERIVSGRLNVGDQLPSENEIAEQYGVSRPVVREALLRLRARNSRSDDQNKSGDRESVCLGFSSQQRVNANPDQQEGVRP